MIDDESIMKTADSVSVDVFFSFKTELKWRASQIFDREHRVCTMYKTRNLERSNQQTNRIFAFNRIFLSQDGVW